MNKKIKKIVKAYSGLLSYVFYFFMNNWTKGKRGNVFHRQNVFLNGFRLSFYGKGNEVVLGGAMPSFLKNCHIKIFGNNNKIVIESGVSAKNLTIYCADNNCRVLVREGTQISGNTELATMEGTKIEIGHDCLFSANITLRAGDSHSVVNVTTGERINPSKDIVIGDHVWIGNTVIVTKGTIIGSNSVVATGSVVAGKIYPNNVALGGNPAKIIKENVNWSVDKI